MATPGGATTRFPFPVTAVGTIPPVAPGSSFCLDTRPPGVIRLLRTALLTSDGSLLSSLVDPIHGMDVQLLRNGTIVDYDRQHGEHLFESDYSVDWGAAPGSGRQIRGSFRKMVVPALIYVLTKDYALECNELRVGGATYTPVWPFPTIDFYSVHVAGTQANGGLDWRTWAVGMQSVADKMYIRAMTQFQWEP